MADIIASPAPASLEDRLDADITRVRDELEALRREHSNLRAALLSSTKIQSRIKDTNGQPEFEQRHERNPTQQHISEDLETQTLHNTTNVYRLAFGVTSFPFTDPAPENIGKSPLLGVRFDIPSGRNGEFSQSPYYTFLKKIKEGSTLLTVHHHTIPAHIDLEGIAKKFLPLPEVDEETLITGGEASQNGHRTPSNDADDEVEGDHSPHARYRELGTDHNHDRGVDLRPKQNLHAFASHVRAALVSFHLRNDTILYVAEMLKLNPDPQQPSKSVKAASRSTPGTYSVVSLTAGDTAARQVRIVWDDGSVGRVKISDEGEVVMAVIFGGKDNKRLIDAERVLTSGPAGEKVRIDTLAERLKLCHDKGFWK